MNNEKTNKKTRFSDDKLILILYLMLALIPLFNGLVILSRDGGMHSSYYFVGYSTGFGARKLLGTIFSFILPDYTTHQHLVPYIFGALFVLFLLFGIFLSRTFKGTSVSKNHNALPFLLLSVIYLTSSYSLLFCHTLVWFADIWLYLLTIVFILLYAKHRSRKWWPVVYCLIILTACLIHHSFCCLFLPLFAALFIYDILDGNKLSLRPTLIYGSTFLMVGVLFFCLWKFSSLNVSPETLSAQLEQRADKVCDNNPWMLNILYSPSKVNYDAMREAGQFPLRYWQFPFLILLLSPLLGLYVTPWILSMRHTRDRVEKRKYALLLTVSVVMFLPIFVVATDYGRWMMAFFFCQTLLLLTMYRMGDTHIIASLRLMFGWMQRHLIISIFFIAYILLLRISPTDNAGVNILSYAHELYRNLNVL